MIRITTQRTTEVHFLCTVLCIGALLLGLASTANAQSKADDCRVQRQQILSQFDHLPSELQEIGLLPRTEAKLVFSVLDNERKTSLWREHLSNYLATQPALTPGQRDAVYEALILVERGLFEVDRSQEPLWSSLHEDLRALDEKVREIFREDKAVEIFSSLGPHPGPAFGRIFLRSGIEGGVTATALCSCATDSDYCPRGYTCQRNGCTVDPDSCGTFWAFDCNGQCQ